MKNLELQNFSVIEMDAREMEEMNGGIVTAVAVTAAVVGIAVGLYELGYAAGKSYSHFKHSKKIQ